MTYSPMTVIHRDGSETVYPADSLISQAHRALSMAADRMGKSGYAAHKAGKHGKRPFSPSQEHVSIMEAMPKLLAGAITPEEAMAMLHEHDTMKQRLA